MQIVHSRKSVRQHYHRKRTGVHKSDIFWKKRQYKMVNENNRNKNIIIESKQTKRGFRRGKMQIVDSRNSIKRQYQGKRQEFIKTT